MTSASHRSVVFHVGAMRLAATIAAAFMLVWPAQAQAPLTDRPGWLIVPTSLPFDRLVAKLEAAIAANGMGLVTAASASEGAKAQGISIPGNRVVGVFRNDFARRMLAASIPAGIEAPIRFYLTEQPGKGSTLSYRTPSTVFAPYVAGADDLAALARELDPIFARIAREATAP